METSKKISKKMKKREHKNYHYVPFNPTRNLTFQKKIAIKLKKLKYTIMASFQAKIGWEKPTNRKNKNYRSVPFLHDA